MLFRSLSRLFPSLSTKCNKNLLVCDHCELAKHTRAVFPISRIRSSKPFVLIHSNVWGPCSTNTLMGHRWFVTFIDCFSRVTWVYLLKKKMGVLNCFKEFHKLVSTSLVSKLKFYVLTMAQNILIRSFMRIFTLTEFFIKPLVLILLLKMELPKEKIGTYWK